MIIKYLICFAMILSLSGCLFRENIEKLSTLKTVAASQEEITDYLKQQEDSFKKLVEDIKNQKLNLGISKFEFIEIYGEPIISKLAPGAEAGTRLLYRHPTKYFNSDKVYIHFNEREELIRWEYKPYPKPD